MGARMSLVAEIQFSNVPSQDGSGSDIVIRLANGRVIQVSPEFNSVNLWDSAEAWEAREYCAPGMQVVRFDMGGSEG